MYDVAIIGCGIIGAAAAHALSMYDLRVAVLEKENDVATGATRANSAIIHAGYDPEPGTLMARLNVRGNEMTRALCEELDVPYLNNGSLVLAFSEADMRVIEALYHRGKENGVPGLRLLTREETLSMEPNVSECVLGALYAPSAGIVNPWEYALALAETAVVNGVKLYLNAPVTSVSKLPGGFALDAGSERVEAKFVINCAGVDSDKVHQMVAEKTFTVHPSRGDYYLMDKSAGGACTHVLFQCPSEAGKGVLISPTVHGNLIVGPDAVPCEDKHRVNTTSEGLNYVRSMAAKTMPKLDFRASIRNFAGMRANTDQKDFIIQFAAPGFLDLAGIKSPGLSSAPAIAEEAVKLLRDAGLALTKKPSAIRTRKKTRFKALTDDQKAEAIRENPLYGRVICRCETITEAEIVEAIHSPIPPVSVDGVKRRAGSGMGRCQGGFCGPRVVEILARELGKSPTEILKDTRNSFILVSETKKERNAQ